MHLSLFLVGLGLNHTNLSQINQPPWIRIPFKERMCSNVKHMYIFRTKRDIHLRGNCIWMTLKLVIGFLPCSERFFWNNEKGLFQSFKNILGEHFLSLVLALDLVGRVTCSNRYVTGLVITYQLRVGDKFSIAQNKMKSFLKQIIKASVAPRKLKINFKLFSFSQMSNHLMILIDISFQDLIASKAMFTGWNPRGIVQTHSFPE